MGPYRPILLPTIVLENPVVLNEDRKEIKRLARAGWWLVANDRLITNKSLTNMTLQTSAG